MEKHDLVVRLGPGQKLQPKIVSIRGFDSDAFDRYKTKQLFVQIVGKGKMIKTVLLNVDDVAHDLKTEPEYIGAYFGYELSAQSKYDAKKPDRERASVSGEQQSSVLTSLMRKFIKELVLCNGCGLPENTLTIDKKDVVASCSSCGHSAPLKLENSKFHKFILSHPPQVQNTTHIPTTNAPSVKKAPSSGDSSEESPKPVSTPKYTQPALDDDDDTVWSISTDQAAVRARQAELLPTAMVSNKPAEVLKPFTEKHHTPETFVTEAKRVQSIANLDSRATVEVLFGLFFTADNVSLKDTAKNALPYLTPFLADTVSEKAFLDSLLELVFDKPDLVKKFTPLVKQYYDIELISEDSIIEWFKETQPKTEEGKAVLATLQPMIDWLEQAEEDDEDEEDDE